MIIEQSFIEILQIAVGTRQRLSVMLTPKEWRELLELSKKQAMTAVAFRGVKTLSASTNSAQAGSPLMGESMESDCGASIGMDEMTYLRWLGLSAKVAQRNRVLNEICASLCEKLSNAGFHSCILKGQSNLVVYPEDLRECRTAGDIDVWCAPVDNSTWKQVIEWVLADWKRKGSFVPEVQYHHINWEYKGVEVEVHFRPSWMNHPIHNARLQRWCKRNRQFGFETYEGFNVPMVRFNAVYQLVHIYRHLFNEGIGLRQLLDYYFVLRTLGIEQETLSGSFSKSERFDHRICMSHCAESAGKATPSNVEIMRTLKSFGLSEFAGAVMFVLQKVFDPSLRGQEFDDWQKRWPWMICKPDARRGEFLLNEIMLAGNFGKYDTRNVIGQNENYFTRFIRRQKRFLRFLSQYPSEVIWGPYFSVKQRMWRMWHGWR